MGEARNHVHGSCAVAVTSPRPTRSSHASAVCLDYSTYPQIVHAIATHACPQTKLALRATSRALRRQLDPGIFSHLVLQRGPRMFASRAAGASLPGQAWRGSHTAAEAATWRQRLMYTRVVDQCAAPEGNEWQLFESIGVALRNVNTVRWLVEDGRESPYLPLVVSPNTLVVFAHTCREPHIQLGAARYEVAPTRYVASILYDPTASACPEPLIRFGPVCSSHVVFLFVPHHCLSSRSKGQAAALDLCASLLSGILDFIARGNCSLVTLVGVEGIPRRLLGLPEDSNDEAVRNEISNTIASQLSSRPDVILAQDDTLDRLELLTMAQYRAQVGDAQFQLETVHPGLPSKGPARTPPGVLDHTAFPHIMANIVRCASHETLLQLRRTSHAVKELADARLFEHVVVHRASKSPHLLLHGADGRLPHNKWWDETSYLYAPDEAATARIGAPFANTRLLEMRNDMSGRYSQETTPIRGLLKASPNLEVVRHLTDHPVIIPGVTNVIYTGYLSVHPCPRPRTFLANKCAEAASRLVVNILYDLGCLPVLPQCGSDIEGPFTVPVVLVLSPSHRDPENLNANLTTDARDAVDDLLHLVGHFATSSTNLTVVGCDKFLTDVRCDLMDVIAGNLPNTDAARMDANVAFLLDQNDSSSIGKAMTRILQERAEAKAVVDQDMSTTLDLCTPRYMSHAEYTAEVGPTAEWHTATPSLNDLWAGSWDN